METNNKFSYEVKVNNPIVNAYKMGNCGVVLDQHASNPTRLHRFVTRYGIEATGKNVGGKYVVVFWTTLMEKMKGEQNATYSTAG